MHEQIGAGRNSPELIALFSFQRPKIVFVFWLIVCAISLLGIRQLSIDTSTSSFLDRSSPEWSDYQRSLTRHGGDEFLVIALDSPEPWDLGTLIDVARLSEKFKNFPGVRRVDSLATVPLIRSASGELLVSPGLGRDEPFLNMELAELRALVEEDRIASRSLVSEDGRVFAINLVLDRDVDSPRQELVRDVDRALHGKAARVTGVPVFRTEVNARTQSELTMFVPVTIVLLAAVIALFIPSAFAVLLPLSVGLISTVVTLGAMGAIGVTLSLSTTILPSILLALGCAYAMHLVSSRRDAESIARVSFPIVLSGVTTTIGFLAMATIPIDAIKELSTYGALGVAVATFSTVTLGPAAAKVFGDAKQGNRVGQWLRLVVSKKLGSLIVTRGNVAIGLWVFAVSLSAAGLARLDVSTDIILWFPQGSDIRENYESIRKDLAGITPVNILVEPRSEEVRDVHSVEIVKKIDELSTALDSHDDVGKVLSVSDALRMTKRSFVSNGESDLPASDAEVEQLLLLLSGMDRLGDVLHQDRRSANILLRLDNNSSRDVVELAEWVTEWWREFGSLDYRVSTTGIMYEFARAEEEIAQGQIVGLALAAISIGLVLFLFLRTIRSTLVALLANLVPIGVAFGAMGWFSVPLDAATVCLGSMALGIAVDDTIHLIVAYRSAAADGEDQETALRTAFARVLPALVMTTLSISVGFIVLVTSGFTLIRNLGAVTAALVTLCLVADLTLLPALLVGEGRPRRSSRKL